VADRAVRSAIAGPSFWRRTVGGGGFPNEPGGFTLVSDYDMSDVLPVGQGVQVGTSGWFINNDGLATRVTDGSAPQSPSFVGQWSYPIGFEGGFEPAIMFQDIGGGNEIYFAFYWKPSNPWEDHPSGNKIAFQFLGGGEGGGQIFIMMTATSHVLRPTTEMTTDARNLEPNVNSTEITLGQWHLIEWYMRKSPSTMKWWLDNVLQGNYTDVVWPANAFAEAQFAPTWGGGTGIFKTQQDYYWYDHVRLSRHA
jgi:hypothetical protein